MVAVIAAFTGLFNGISAIWTDTVAGGLTEIWELISKFFTV